MKYFIKILILCHYDPERHIYIDINLSDYMICKVLI